MEEIGLDISINNIWLLVTTFLVMFMQPGFAMVEAGFTRSKNTANILMKNLLDFAIGSLVYWLINQRTLRKSVYQFCIQSIE